MTKKYQIEIVTPSPTFKKWCPVFDELSEEEKPKYDRFIELFNRYQETPWKARIVEVKEH